MYFHDSSRRLSCWRKFIIRYRGMRTAVEAVAWAGWPISFRVPHRMVFTKFDEYSVSRIDVTRDCLKFCVLLKRLVIWI